jgi:formylglycine-generating enzyme required for sulfatase activity
MPAVRLVFVLAATASCVPGLDGLTGGCRDGGCTDARTGDARVDALAPCTGKAGPAGIRIVQGDHSYCIDATEVTQDDYAQFVANAGPPSGLPPECASKTSFASDGGAPSPGNGTMPVVQVDWCDAFAFCRWAGKRLCGTIDSPTPALLSENDLGTSEWYRACAGPDGRPYPYGSTFDPKACIGETTAAANVGSATGCRSAEGVFDLSGNVEEWVGACTAAYCLSRGGNYGDSPSKLTCTSDTSESATSNLQDRMSRVPYIGFRCCSD